MSSGSGSVAGRVVDAVGAPVPGVSVTVSGSTQPVPDIAALTNAEGRFRLGSLPPGSYTVTAHSAGHPPAETSVVVAVGEQAHVEIRLHG